MTEKTEKELYEFIDNFSLNLSGEDRRIVHSDLESLVDGIKNIVDKNSSIRQVEEFMNTFNQKVRTKPEMPSPKECLFRLELCKEELVEAAEACGSEVLCEFGLNLYKTSEKIRYQVENEREHLKPNLVKLFDALKDMPYVAYGFECTAGLQDKSDEAALEVHSSNMSKACNGWMESEETKASYKLEGIETVSEEKEDKKTYLILRNSDRKVLKSINYRPANLAQFINGI